MYLIKGLLYCDEIFRSNLKKQIKTLKITTSFFWFLHVYNTWVILSKFSRVIAWEILTSSERSVFYSHGKQKMGMKLASVRVTVGHFVSGENKALTM